MLALEAPGPVAVAAVVEADLSLGGRSVEHAALTEKRPLWVSGHGVEVLPRRAKRDQPATAAGAFPIAPIGSAVG